MQVNQWLSSARGDQRGITGVETAIILIAFVVVASVFAYTVLSAGMFSAEKGKQAIYAGIEQARGTMAVTGGIIMKDTGAPASSTADDDGVDQIVFTVANALDGESIDLATTIDSDDDGRLNDESGKTHTTVVSYIDANRRVDDIAWTKTDVGKGDSDDLLEPGERMQITVNLSQLARINGSSLGIDTEFTIEVKPDRGSALVIERTTPAVIDNVMYLN